MNTTLKISVLANIVMALLILWLGHRTLKDAAPGAPAIIAGAPETQVVAVTSSVLAQDSFKPFRWSQLESSDYRSYVANLRGIGCPEQTIRDIITADVDSLYAPRRLDLEHKKASKANTPFTADLVAQQELKAGLDRLNNEEAAAISLLLGSQPTPIQPDVNRRPEPRALRDRPAVMPLVFQNVDPAALHLDSSQLAVISDLRQKFEVEIGGPGQDPSDPEYRQRWQAAQRESDDMLQGFLGSQFVQNYELEVLQKQQTQAIQP